MSQADDNPNIPRRVGVREFRSNLTDILRQARQGRSFVVTSHDQILAEIHPPSVAIHSHRRAGALRGQIRMAEDFDVLPSQVLSAMTDGEP